MTMVDRLGVKVSICSFTFEHERFIAASLKSFIDQKFDKPIEIIVHDDASTDGTVQIIKNFAALDSRIHPILRTTNLYSTGVQVFPEGFKHARGEYIAICEGDDHWIDPYKLQRQIDVLDADEHAVACFTDAYNVRDGVRERYYNGIYAIEPRVKLFQKDFIAGQNIPTCTVVFRRSALGAFSRLVKNARVSDVILFTHLANSGYFIYQPCFTGVRNMHAGGVHSLQSRAHKTAVVLHTLPFIDRASRGIFRKEILTRRRRLLLNAWSEAINNKDAHLARLVWPMIARDRKALGWNITTTLRNFMKAYLPKVEAIYTRIFEGNR